MHQHQNTFDLLSGAPPGSATTSKKRKKRRKKKSGKGGAGGAAAPVGEPPVSSSPAAYADTPDVPASDVVQISIGAPATDDFEDASDAPLDEAYLGDEEAQLREALRRSAVGAGVTDFEGGSKPSDGFTAVKTKTRKKKKEKEVPPANGKLRAPISSSRSSGSSRDGISRASSDVSLSEVSDVSRESGPSDSDAGAQRSNGHRGAAQASATIHSEASSIASSEPPSSAASPLSVGTRTQTPRSELQPAPLSSYNAPKAVHRVNQMARGPVVETAKPSGQTRVEAPRKTSERDALDEEIESWDPAGSPRVLHKWTKIINREHNNLKQRRLQSSTKAPEPPPFWSMFSDLCGLERVARKVLEANGRVPFDAIAKLFALCMYGSDEFHRWFLEKLRAVSQKVKDSSSRSSLVDVAMRAVAVLKIPCRPTELRCERTMQLPFDSDDSARKIWSSLDSSFDSFLKTRSRLSALQYEIAQYTPTEEFRHQFTVAMGELDGMIEKFNSAFTDQKTLRANRNQLKAEWLEKNESEIKPREDVIQEMQTRIDAHRARKQQMLLDLQLLENEIQNAMHEQDRVQNAVNEWRQEIQTQVNRVEEEDRTLSTNQERQKADLVSARALHDLLNTGRSRLLQETDKSAGRFRNLQVDKTQGYIQSFEHVLASYASFVEYYHNRAQLLRDHLERTKQQHQASIDLGLAAAATSEGLVVIKSSMDQAARLVEEATREVEEIVESTLRLVDTREPDFINLVNRLPPKVTNTLPLAKLEKYRTEPVQRPTTLADESGLHTEEKSSVYNPSSTTEPSTSFYDKAPPSVLDVKTQTAPVEHNAASGPPTGSMSRAAQMLASGPSPSASTTDFGAASMEVQSNRSRPSSAQRENDSRAKKPNNAGRGPSNPRRQGSNAGSRRSSRPTTPRSQQQQRSARDHRLHNAHSTGQGSNQQAKRSSGNRNGQQSNGRVQRQFRPKAGQPKANVNDGASVDAAAPNGGSSLPKGAVWGTPRQ